MDDVERFLADLQELFASSPRDRDEMKNAAHRQLAAFIGRAAERGDQYAATGEILGLLAEARGRLQGMESEGYARNLRVEILTELDKAIAAITPRRPV